MRYVFLFAAQGEESVVLVVLVVGFGGLFSNPSCTLNSYFILNAAGH